MATLNYAMLALAEIVMPNMIKSGTATSDGAVGKTTLIDSNRDEPEGFFITSGIGAGTIFFTSGTNDGLSRVITAADFTGTTFTFAAVTAKTLIGDTYLATPLYFQRQQLIDAINRALNTIGSYWVWYEDAAFVTVTDQITYDLPSGVFNIKDVEIATNTSAPYGYVPHSHWEEEISDGSYNGLLRFHEPTQPKQDDYRIRVKYVVSPPADLDTDDDDLPYGMNVDLIKWVAAVHLLRGKANDPRWNGILNEALLREKHLLSVHRDAQEMSAHRRDNLGMWSKV